jgi:hypothetical protein
VTHVYGRSEGIWGSIVTDKEYPAKEAHQLLSKICDEFLTKYPGWASSTEDSPQLSFPELKDYLAKYQNPQNVDNISKIQKELDETKIVLHKTIESVLERGEKIDDLVAKSDGLSAQSKMFYTQVRRRVWADLCPPSLTVSARPRSRTHAASSCKHQQCFRFFSSDYLQVHASRATPLAYYPIIELQSCPSASLTIPCELLIRIHAHVMSLRYVFAKRV